MNILIIGSGGREHALAWKIAQSPQANHVFVAPGNGGTASEPKVTNVPIDPLDFASLFHFAKTNGVHFTVVGPEVPLAQGIVDAFENMGLRCFGPSKAAAQLEASKAFSKAFMQRHKIPTANFAVFTEAEEAKAYISHQSLPIVIKVDGLAAGKGVVIATSASEALATIDAWLPTYPQIVIEEFLQGEELSFIVITDGHHMAILPSTQDHKTRDEGDKGPNTGGMGAYSPTSLLTPQLEKRIMQEIMHPTLAGMAQEGRPYAGFLYAGLMITPEGNPKVLEFNCRLGDPEAQVILPRLQSDLIALFDMALKKSLAKFDLVWDARPSLGVVLAAKGYPKSPQTGDFIEGLDTISSSPHIKIFHAGTKQINSHVVTDGGRVLCVTAMGNSLLDAKNAAFIVVDQIHWDGMFYRKDIGYKELDRQSQA